MAQLIQCRVPITKTHIRWCVWDERNDTIKTFKAKFPAIAYMHTNFGTPLESQWAFPTLFADMMRWVPDKGKTSHWDACTKTFTFTSPVPANQDDIAIWSFVKDTTLTQDIPTDEKVMAAAHKLDMRGLSILSNHQRAQIQIIATWLSKSNPNRYTEYLALYPVNELANYISVYSEHYFDTPTNISQDLILAVASAMGHEPTFKCTSNPRQHITMWTRQFGAIHLPQKLPATIYDYSSMHLYAFSDRFLERSRRKTKTERARYDTTPNVKQELEDFRKMKLTPA